jgi:hypothetical protein
VEERGRQQACRERRRGGGCHAPASSPKPTEIQAELLDSWDRAAALSRATLRRRLAGILRGIVRCDETAPPVGRPLSRATLASQMAESTGG